MNKTRKNKKSNKLTICNSKYALCTSAPCNKINNKPGKTRCLCSVEKGYNFATKPCKKLLPYKSKNGTKNIYSTFSVNEMKRDGKKITECPKKDEWSDCLNHKCFISPENPKFAICECSLRKSNKNWYTMGAHNKQENCSRSIWSGAHKKDFYATRKYWNGFFKNKKNMKNQMIDDNNDKIINKL